MFSSIILLGDGWHPEETDGTHPFRWMKKEASFFVKDYRVAGKKHLLITAAGHSQPEEKRVRLQLYINNKEKGTKIIDGSFCSYAFSFQETGDLRFDFVLDKAFHVPGDARELGIMLRRAELLTPYESDVFLEGWYVWEYDDLFPFRWMKKQARINLSSKEASQHKFVSFHIFSEFPDFSQKLSISADGKASGEITLLPEWNFYSFPSHHDLFEKKAPNHSIGKETSHRVEELTFTLNKVFPSVYHEDDQRELGVRVSSPEFHSEWETHRRYLFFHRNALLNDQEMREGKTKLESFPLNLGVDLYGKCNIRPPCVYCLWDRMKQLEGHHVDVDVDEKTLESYGPFFQSARLLINCSFGEPLLHPRFTEILEHCQRRRKILEISTNGQAFTRRTIQVLVGKPVYLYVSLDAACRETYAKIRNDRWDSIVPNLILLNEERKKKGNLPKIFMVFMPMKVNLGDLEDYFRLCQKVEADSLVLRPLNYLENPQIEVDRGGYHFDYEKELLSSEEIKEVFRRCDEYSRKYNVAVANQFTFGEGKKLGGRKDSPEKQRF